MTFDGDVKVNACLTFEDEGPFRIAVKHKGGAEWDLGTLALLSCVAFVFVPDNGSFKDFTANNLGETWVEPETGEDRKKE